MKIQKLIFVGIAALLAAGCAGNTIPDPDADNGSTLDGANGGAETDGLNNGGIGDGEDFDDTNDMDELTMVIYFDFDQSDLRAEYSDTLQRHAGRLSDDGLRPASEEPYVQGWAVVRVRAFGS